MFSTFLRILADPSNAHLWINSTGMPTSMALRLSFNLSGIDPSAPSTTGITLDLFFFFFSGGGGGGGESEKGFADLSS